MPLPSVKKRILSALGVCATAWGLTMALLAAVYALRGIWPFGTDNVAYMDTAQFYVPGYYDAWESMHRLVTGGGGSWTSLLYPYNWAYLLVPRDHVLEGLSLYLALQMGAVAVMAGAVLSARFPGVRGLWRVCFALSYTFCGFVLQYYSNFSWFSTVTVFPLYLLGLERLLRRGRYGLYALVYAYYLHTSTYYTFMVTVYTLLFTLGYCLLVLPREQRGDRLFRLGAATAAAYGVCAPSWMRQASSLAGQARFQQNIDTGIAGGMSTWNLPNTRHTFLMLLGLGLVTAVLLRTFSDRRTAQPPLREGYRRATRFFLYMAGVFLLPMVFTNIDTAWHFGQYNLFPMRYGYMLPATAIGFAGAALQARPEADPVPEKRRMPLRAAAVAGAVLIAALMPGVTALWREYGACFLTAAGKTAYLRCFAALALCGAAAVTVYYALLRSPRQRAAAWAAAVLVPLQLGVNAFGLIAPSDDHTYTNEYDPAYIEQADSLYEYFSGRDIPPFSRAKNVDSSLNAGYPAIAGIGALSSVNSGNSATRLGVFRDLGYTVNYFRILDVGGTVFTDMLLGVDYILSATEPDPALYLPGDTVDGIQVAVPRYGGVTGLTYDPGALEDYFTLETVPDRLNALYRAFTGEQNALAVSPVPEITAEGTGMRRYTVTLRLDSPAFLYMAADGMMMDISVDGRALTVPTYQNLDNTIYPAPFNANLLCLGLHGPGAVEIGFFSAMDLTGDALTLFGLDKAALDSFSRTAGADAVLTYPGDGSVTVRVNADREGLALFLPSLDPGAWRCTVNGRDTDTGRFLDVMLSVPLREGENTVVLTAGGTAPGTDYRDTVSRVALALAGLWALALLAVPRLRSAAVPKPLGVCAQVLFFAAAAAAVGFVYVAPTVRLLSGGTVIWF